MKCDLFAIASLVNTNNCIAIMDFSLSLGMLCFSGTRISKKIEHVSLLKTPTYY